ncbi:MAG: hypothetical protein HY784_05655 [Chloroflexi bacterium]|nr:hypothetical protein [Chloroflexota bacterium]
MRTSRTLAGFILALSLVISSSAPPGALASVQRRPLELGPEALSGTVNINSGATYTTNRQVSLGLSTSGATGPVEMRFSNDNVTYTPYEPFAASKTWTLPNPANAAFVRYSPQPTYDPPPTPSGQPISLGVLLSIPAYNANQTAAAAASLGVKYSRFSANWIDTEPTPGNFTFAGANDFAISQAEGAGLRAFPTLTIGKGWMNGQPPDAQSKSYPPSDLSQSYDPNTAYSPTYYRRLD